MKKLISIVIPAYNEEEVVPELTKRLSKFMDTFTTYNFEVVVVEHGSKDKTLSELIKAHKKINVLKSLNWRKMKDVMEELSLGLISPQATQQSS